MPPRNWIAMRLGPRNRSPLPRARVALEHAARTVQAAYYHLYMAHYERLRLSTYSDPPNVGGGNIAAYYNFTSFSLHAIAAERHLVLAVVTQHRINELLSVGKKLPASKIKTDEAYRYLTSSKLSYVTVLMPFVKDEDWKWLRLYRDRYEHEDPMLVKELGIQYRLKRAIWDEDEDLEAGTTTYHIGFGGGDPAETNIEEMLGRGVRGFNLLGKQLDVYTTMLMEEIEREGSHNRLPLRE